MLNRLVSNSLRQYLSRLSPRDQNALKLLTAFLAFVIAWLGIWNPINALKNSFEQQYLAEASNIDWMRAHATTLKAKQLIGQPTTQQNSTTLLTSLSSTAAKHQVTIEHAESPDENHFQISVSNTTFANLLTWLDELRQNLNLRCPQITVEHSTSNEGMINANLTLVL